MFVNSSILCYVHIGDKAFADSAHPLSRMCAGNVVLGPRAAREQRRIRRGFLLGPPGRLVQFHAQVHTHKHIVVVAHDFRCEICKATQPHTHTHTHTHTHKHTHATLLTLRWSTGASLVLLCHSLVLFSCAWVSPTDSRHVSVPPKMAFFLREPQSNSLLPLQRGSKRRRMRIRRLSGGLPC